MLPGGPSANYDQRTFKDTVVVLVATPGEVPVMVSVLVPVVVLRVVTICNWLVPEPVTVAGLNVAVAFNGTPDTERLTAPEKPPDAVTVTVKVAVPPRFTTTAEGEALRLKDGVAGAEMVSMIVVVAVRLPEAPVTVIG